MVSDCLKNHFRFSEEKTQLLIQLGAIYIEKNRIFEDTELKKGGHLRLYPSPRRFHVSEVDWSKVVLKETEDFVVLDKPSGIPTIATTDNGLENVLEQLRRSRNENLLVTSRLDTPTSGLLVVARTKPFQVKFNDWLRDGKVEKIYTATTEKAVPLGLLVHYMKPGEELPKIVSAELQKGWLKCTLDVMSCEPFQEQGIGYFKHQLKLLTGRTHQIRAQLADLGAPIVGDREYGFKGKAPIVGKREIALRAISLAFNGLTFEASSQLSQ